MRSFLVASLLALSACVDGRPECPGAPLTVFSDDCATAMERVVLARELLDKHGLVAADDFREEFSWATITVHPEEQLSFNGPSEVMGRFEIGTGVEVARDMGSLVHELLHAHDAKRLRLGTIGHLHWQDNGYYAAADDYCAMVEPPPSSPAR